jgi:ribosomal protein S18 acetylase RimI-like enzyme
MKGRGHGWSLDSLTRANEENMYALTPFRHHWPGALKHTGDDVSWCVTDIPFPWCNVAFGAHLDKRSADKAIEDFDGAGRERNVPVCWLLGAGTTPSDLGRRLKRHGFVKRGDTRLMALDLHGMKDGGPAPSDLTIEEVESREALSLWCSVAAAGFAIPPSAEPSLFKWFSLSLDNGLPLRFFLGFMRGLPVATSALLLAGSVAGLYFITTVPSARRQGIGRALTLAPLEAARRLGYSLGALQASKMGKSMYRGLGFRSHGTMVSYIKMYGIF